MSIIQRPSTSDEKLSICIVNTHFFDTVGGSQLQCDIIAEELQKRGHKVTYLAVDGKDKTYNTSYSVVGVKRNGGLIGKKISNIDPDILYWRFNKKFFYKSLKSSANNNMKVVFAVSNIRDLQPLSATLRSPISIQNFKNYVLKNIVSLFNHLGFFYVDALTVNNENQLDLSIKSTKIYVPNATNVKSDIFKWHKPFVLWVANIKDRKQPELFVKLARNFVHKEVDFLMMGKIEDQKYEWLQDQNKVSENFHYLGSQPIEKVNGALKESLFLVTTSTPEGFSNNIIQAWLQATPVVAYEFDPGGLIQEHELGYVSSGDFNRFSENVEKMIDDVNLRTHLGEKSLEFACDHFSTNKTIDLLENLFYNILKKK